VILPIALLGAYWAEIEHSIQPGTPVEPFEPSAQGVGTRASKAT
jgi:hypothetical protein